MSDSDPDLLKTDEIPNYIIISLAKLLLPEIQVYYSSDEGNAFFEALETKPQS